MRSRSSWARASRLVLVGTVIGTSLVAAATLGTGRADALVRGALGTTTSTTPSAAARSAQAASLPKASVVDLRTGRTIALRAVSDGRPLVLWFWAPG